MAADGETFEEFVWLVFFVQVAGGGEAGEAFFGGAGSNVLAAPSFFGLLGPDVGQLIVELSKERFGRGEATLERVGRGEAAANGPDIEEGDVLAYVAEQGERYFVVAQLLCLA